MKSGELQMVWLPAWAAKEGTAADAEQTTQRSPAPHALPASARPPCGAAKRALQHVPRTVAGRLRRWPAAGGAGLLATRAGLSPRWGMW